MANPERAIGRCFDNRMGCALLIQLLRHFAEHGLRVLVRFHCHGGDGMSNYSRFWPFGRSAGACCRRRQAADLAIVVQQYLFRRPGLPEYG